MYEINALVTVKRYPNHQRLNAFNQPPRTLRHRRLRSTPRHLFHKPIAHLDSLGLIDSSRITVSCDETVTGYGSGYGRCCGVGCGMAYSTSWIEHVARRTVAP